MKILKYQEYIQELYWRGFYSFLGFSFGSLTAYFEKESIIYVLVQPLEEGLNKSPGMEIDVSFVFLRITEAFTTEIFLSLLLGLFSIIPLIWVHIWFFFAPSLYPDEQKRLGSILLISWLLLTSGIYVTNYFLLPHAWSFFLSFANIGGESKLSYLPSFLPYINLSIEIFFGIILSSQIPIGLFLAIHWNWFNQKDLVYFRPWVFLALLFWAGLISPPDPYSQILFFLPLYFCYEFLVLILFCLKHIK